MFEIGVVFKFLWVSPTTLHTGYCSIETHQIGAGFEIGTRQLMDHICLLAFKPIVIDALFLAHFHTETCSDCYFSSVITKIVALLLSLLISIE